ncbi:MAG: hypothetical protein Q9N34_10390 [Aquificota bacterium]|nr:hypothetical protein [Aquificota bacterium]
MNISYEDLQLYELLSLDRPPVEIFNPLVPSQRYMRSSLLPSLLRTAKFNENHYNYDLAICHELGRVFLESGRRDRLRILVKGAVQEFPSQRWDHYMLSQIVQGIFGLCGSEPQISFSQLPFLHPYVQAELFLEGER